MSSPPRSLLFLFLTLVTLLLFAEAFRFSIISTSASTIRKSLRNVDTSTSLISCNKLLNKPVATASSGYSDFFTCLRASKDMPLMAAPAVGKNNNSRAAKTDLSSSGFFKLQSSQLRSFPLKAIQLAATLSHLSYLNNVEEQLSNKLMDNLFHEVVEGDSIAQSRAHVWISPKSRTAFVSFRGTSSWVDVLHDLDTRSVPVDLAHSSVYRNATVHAGFRFKFFSIKNRLESALQQKADKFDSLVITGHSLGGALATLSAPYLAELLPNTKITCISFGSPRVGNEKFVEWFKSKVHSNVRLLNENDPVPHLPLGPAYHHVSDGVCIVPDSEVYGFPEIPIGQRLFWAMDNLDLSQITTSHDLQTYITRVNNMYN